MRGYLNFNGIDTRTYGVYVSGGGTFLAPARAYDFESVPGRNGALVGNEKRLENIEVTYPAFCYANTKANLRGFRNALLSSQGYQRLTDSYHPDEYRMAAYAGPFDPEMRDDMQAGTFEIVFNCKPQRYLTSGESWQTFESTGTIDNPTLFDSLPWLRVYGKGTFSIGSTTVTISSDSPYSYIDIDCEMMDAYQGAVNCNRYVSVSGNNFPVFKPGSNGINLGAGITKLQTRPRWWRV